MENILELKEQRDAKMTALETHLARFDSNPSLYIKEEKDKTAELEREIEGFNVKIKAIEDYEKERQKKVDRKAAQERKGSPEQQLASSFSFHRAFTAAKEQRSLDGAEKEAADLASDIVKATGAPAGTGQIQIPTAFVEMRSKRQIERDNERAMSVGTTTAGGHTVATTTMPLVPVLRPRLRAIQMGTNVVGGMTGNLTFPRHTTVESASMNSEVGAGNEVTPTLDTYSASPHRIECYTTVSKQLLIQSQDISEQWIRNNLELAIATTLDAQVLNGSGAGNNIEGIANISGIGSSAWNASDPYATLVGLETAIAVDNADVDNMGYLTTPGMKGQLKITRLDTGSGTLVWGQGSNELNGYRAMVSTQVPAATGSTHHIYFGNWADGTIYQWGMLDIVIDPYSLRRSAQVEVVVNMWADYAIQHPESMALTSDGVVS